LSKRKPFLAVASECNSTIATSSFDDQIVDVQFRTIRQDLGQLREGAGNKVSLRCVVAGERMCAHYGPVYVFGNVIEERGAFAMLEAGKDLSHVFSIY
jgi:hypothetical protein